MTKTLVAVVLSSTAAYAICVSQFNPPCPNLNIPCPDGTGVASFCDTDDVKQLNSAGGSFKTAPSSGTCRYDCFYTLLGRSVFCGTKNVNWTGTKADVEKPCPGSGT